MSVNELIDQLKLISKTHGNDEVVCRGYEYGCNEIRQISLDFVEDCGLDWAGDYDSSKNYDARKVIALNCGSDDDRCTVFWEKPELLKVES